jgi:hypothetical protein
VAESLDLLHGPSSGTVRLPAHLDWSGNAVYDLDAPGRIIDLYRAVLIEAATPQDLYGYLDAGILRRLWAMLWLPAQVRRSWEQKFPVLAEISRMPRRRKGGDGPPARTDREEDHLVVQGSREDGAQRVPQVLDGSGEHPGVRQVRHTLAYIRRQDRVHAHPAEHGRMCLSIWYVYPWRVDASIT